MLLVGFLAAVVICVTNGLPLLHLATAALGEISLTDWPSQLPTIMAGLVALAGGVWFLGLLIEEIG